MLKIALPNKGRLADDARELFGDAGLPVLTRGDRALSASLGGEFEALFVRAQDIPEFVADGVADVGVTGWDLVCESGRPVERRLDLGFGECRLIAAGREDSPIRTLDDIAAGTRVATSFPNITRDFFEARRQNVEIVPISGAAEIAPLLGIAELIVDITSTGSTLKVNGLRETMPELPRGIVAQRVYSETDWPETTAAQRKGMHHLRHAFRTRPHFVAYWVNDLPAPAPWIARHVFGLPLLTWTVRTSEQRERAVRYADQMIFEGFRP